MACEYAYLHACTHASIKWVRLSQYNAIITDYCKVLNLGCWYVMCVLVRKP